MPEKAVRVSSDSLVGKLGRVTGRVAPDTVGEVTVAIRGGSEAYFAYPYDGKEEILRGSQVLIVDAAAPRTVYVTAFTA